MKNSNGLVDVTGIEPVTLHANKKANLNGEKEKE
jgi:hypothetical protein